MRKNLFYTVMMMAMMAVASMTFTACGGGDDDALSNPPTNNSNNDGGQKQPDITSFIWPCTQWGCSRSDIKKYMGNSMELTEENKNGLFYVLGDKYAIQYALDVNDNNAGYAAFYYGYSKERMEALKDEYAKRYGLSFVWEGVYRATGYINNTPCDVLVMGLEEQDWFSVRIDLKTL